MSTAVSGPTQAISRTELIEIIRRNCLNINGRRPSSLPVSGPVDVRNCDPSILGAFVGRSIYDEDTFYLSVKVTDQTNRARLTFKTQGLREEDSACSTDFTFEDANTGETKVTGKFDEEVIPDAATTDRRIVSRGLPEPEDLYFTYSNTSSPIDVDTARDYYAAILGALNQLQEQ